ncbi:hypothetical protein EJ06DRAFT_61823 [Trichodelitschia bisporula]|uniref:Uncharacterized protein n=1 Tax=Trichodelitschia bisporula TaxID=703511 RepID=A0A6G1HV08_9PEZI|nr:hypothetical protein EJ06DRAFT_61823 [Trichodelitschia bisporula]
MYVCTYIRVAPSRGLAPGATNTRVFICNGIKHLAAPPDLLSPTCPVARPPHWPFIPELSHSGTRGNGRKRRKVGLSMTRFDPSQANSGNEIPWLAKVLALRAVLKLAGLVGGRTNPDGLMGDCHPRGSETAPQGLEGKRGKQTVMYCCGVKPAENYLRYRTVGMLRRWQCPMHTATEPKPCRKW